MKIMHQGLPVTSPNATNFLIKLPNKGRDGIRYVIQYTFLVYHNLNRIINKG